ncbi:Uncharacterised protein [Achromobacter sp. 2789STDY5608615]|uniref:hypothetical protein n=1 Tax=Achromobacter sp. 2789STDY5608615 TaxID=1806492 RepID=UPI0006C5E366|nr:hypothetical protein [Achromobacter sp. 2789STDY5608615]CUJ82074.1 Uncharacterised protein [Achromobacter sp. 2789STDY5608615]
MDLDDVAEKARRNLMIVSTGILAVWALGIPLDGKLVGAVDLSAVAPWRAWLAASCVLVYFAARHYLAPATAKEWAPWSVRRKKSVTSQLDQSVGTVFRQIPESCEHEVTVSWIDLRHDINMTFNVQIDVDNRRRGTFYYTWFQLSKLTDDDGRREVSDATPSFPKETMQGEYAFTRRFYLKCQWRAFREAYKPSWELLELSFPWFLAIGASIVCACKLVASLFYYSFPFVRQLVLT